MGYDVTFPFKYMKNSLTLEQINSWAEQYMSQVFIPEDFPLADYHAKIYLKRFLNTLPHAIIANETEMKARKEVKNKYDR